MSIETRSLSSDLRQMRAELVRHREALSGAISAWDRWYMDHLPVAAEDDEFGPMLEARSVLSTTPEWMLKPSLFEEPSA